MKHIDHALIKLIKELPENEDPEKTADIIKKILNFNKQQKGKEHPLDLAH